MSVLEERASVGGQAGREQAMQINGAKSILGRRDSKNKGTKAGEHWARLGDSQEATVPGAE